MRISYVLTILTVAMPYSAGAQLLAARDAPVAYGHHHINASDIEAHKRFWIDALGGKPMAIEGSSSVVIGFPNVLVLLREQAPSAGTKGSVVNHVGFAAQDIRATVARLRAGGFRMVTREELPASYDVQDDLGQRAGGNVVAFVMGPDETKVELIEDTTIDVPLRLHHVHWATQDGEAMRAWYAEHFGATPGTRIGQPAADLPGVNLTFGPSADPVAPTTGRALDHIGFEVKDIEAVVRRLEASGITMDRGVTRIGTGLAIAFLTDPWGTNIELTEGLVDLR